LIKGDLKAVRKEMYKQMLDLILAPLAFLYKAWYITPLVILIADKIVSVTPVPWDDLIVTGVKKIYEKINGAIQGFIMYLIMKPYNFFFKKDKEVEKTCTCDKTDCCNK